MSLTERYERLSRKTDQLRQQKAQAEGALDQVISQIKEEHGCSSMKEANELLAEMERSIEDLEEKFDLSLKAFEEKWQ